MYSLADATAQVQMTLGFCSSLVIVSGAAYWAVDRKSYNRDAADASWYLPDTGISRIKKFKMKFSQINIIDPTSMGSHSRIKSE